MSEQQTKPLTYQGRCAIQAFKHSAYALGAIALGHGKNAAAHTKAASLWGALAVYAAGLVRFGRVPQWLLDATWVEPIDHMDDLPDGFEEAN